MNEPPTRTKLQAQHRSSRSRNSAVNQVRLKSDSAFKGMWFFIQTSYIFLYITRSWYLFYFCNYVTVIGSKMKFFTFSALSMLSIARTGLAAMTTQEECETGTKVCFFELPTNTDVTKANCQSAWPVTNIYKGWPKNAQEDFLGVLKKLLFINCRNELLLSFLVKD